MNELTPDPFAACESSRCNHDLGRGVLIEDLMGRDGPFTESPLVDRRRGMVFAVAEERPQPEAA